MDKTFGSNISNRKIRKPLMERKRRARINQSLDELQQLLTETDVTTRGTKLEKADILEMTVQYLKSVKGRGCSREDKENIQNQMIERYLLGYEKCVEEVGTAVDKVAGMESNIKNKIMHHLENCLEKVKKGATCHMDESKSGIDRIQGYSSDQWRGKGQCSVLLQSSKDFRILPSKLPNGDLILLISSDLVKCDQNLTKTAVWRPWW